jgi:cytochrome P450
VIHPTDRSQARALWHELLVYAADHLPALLLVEAVRHLGAVVYVPGVGYMVNDPELGKAILEDSDAFTKTGPGSMGSMITQVLGENALMNMEGPAHRALTSRLHDLFSAAYLDVVSRQVLAEPAARLRRELVDGRDVDLVRFMHRLSGKMICHMLGVTVDREAEDETYERLWAVGARLTAPIGLTTTRLDERDVAARRATFEELMGYARESFERNDGQSDSVIQRLRNLGMSFDEVKSVTAALLTVGTQTVSAAVPRAVALLIDTGQLTLLRARPELRTGAIDEALRYVVPAPIMLRSVEKTRTVAGHEFEAGRRVLILAYNLMKHPRWFPKPRRFDITRQHDRKVKHLWFGAGSHFCLGFNLAFREIGTVLEVLEALPGDLSVVRRRYARNVLIPTYSSLVVRLAPVAKQQHADHGDPAQLGEQNRAGQIDLGAERDRRQREVGDSGGQAEPAQRQGHEAGAGQGGKSRNEQAREADPATDIEELGGGHERLHQRD